jgi:hypothetical protein
VRPRPAVGRLVPIRRRRLARRAAAEARGVGLRLLAERRQAGYRLPRRPRPDADRAR